MSPAEHLRPDGALSQGYFCSRCGTGGVNMVGSGHGPGKCEENPELVADLRRVNGEARSDGIIFRTVRFRFPASVDEVDICVDCGGSGEKVVPSEPPAGMSYVRALDGAEAIDCPGCRGYRIRDDYGEGDAVVVLQYVGPRL